METIQNEQSLSTYEAIETASNEKDLEIVESPIKGRGIRTNREFVKNEFVVEYRGDLICSTTAKQREIVYAEDCDVGCYMYYFTHKNKHVDATDESPHLGRLVNHSVKRPNLRAKVVEIDSRPRLVLVAKRRLTIGEELLYDYGDRTRQAVQNNRWLVES